MRFKRLLFTYCFFKLCALSASLSAMPILTSDGSQLTGVDVKGSLYDIRFGDGVVGDIFPVETITAPGWADLAQAVSSRVQSILDELSQMGGLSPSDIVGCDNLEECTLFLADTFVPDTKFPVWDTDPVIICRTVDNSSCAFPPSATVLAPVWDTSAFSQVTLMTFERAANVPAPSGLTLVGIGIALLLRRHKNWILIAHTRLRRNQ